MYLLTSVKKVEEGRISAIKYKVIKKIENKTIKILARLKS